MSEIRRVENALQSTENPLHIARDCLANRQRRIDTDLVQDDAENNLLKVNDEITDNGQLITNFLHILRSSRSLVK